MSAPLTVRKSRVESTVALRVRKVVKSYPGVKALRSVNFELATGEVHGLVGANGAGKSTLIKMLSGADTPDSGEIEVHGAPMNFDNPRAQRANGIAAIYQELTIIPQMTALSNAFLGAPKSRLGLTDRSAMEAAFREVARGLGVAIPPWVKAGTLSVANQQMLEIMRAILADHDVIIMDEPTAPLGPFERARLYELIGRLKASGASIIFISHDLDEVLSLCDRVSVMREGQLIATRRAADSSKDGLVELMLGDVKISHGDKRTARASAGVLQVDGLRVSGRVEGVSFTLGRGEILGIAGLVGAGRTEVLRALAGAEPTSSGVMALDGVPCAWPRSIRDSIARGIVLAPEDRKHQGLVLSRPGVANFVMADLRSVAWGPLMRRGYQRSVASALARRLGFNPARLDIAAVNLSGGNQQKIVLGKWLHRSPRVLLLDEPTRGIDLGAKQEIYQTIRALSDQGMSVILVSSDLEEVVENADRVLVMARGRQVGLLGAQQASVETILKIIFDVERRPAPKEAAA